MNVALWVGWCVLTLVLMMGTLHVLFPKENPIPLTMTVRVITSGGGPPLLKQEGVKRVDVFPSKDGLKHRVTVDTDSTHFYQEFDVPIAIEVTLP